MHRIAIAVTASALTLAGACGQHTGPTPAKVDPTKAPEATKDAKAPPSSDQREARAEPPEQVAPVEGPPADEPEQ